MRRSIIRRSPWVHASAGTTKVLVCALALLLLAGCGKKGPLEPPAGQPSTYPQAYPRD